MKAIDCVLTGSAILLAFFGVLIVDSNIVLRNYTLDNIDMFNPTIDRYSVDCDGINQT